MSNDQVQRRQGERGLTRRTLMGAGLVSAGLYGCGRAIRSAGVVNQRLAELGIILPEPTAAVATYTPFRVVGDVVYVAGQGPSLAAGAKVFGKLGSDLTVEEGAHAARLAAIGILSQAKVACGGDLDRVVQWVRLTGYVNSTDDFIDQPRVINGASDLLVDVFGEKGLHARAAVGVNTLPFNIAVEIEATFQIRV
ncbi:MAG: RidA family protein [Parvularculaceae bacterium]